MFKKILRWFRRKKDEHSMIAMHRCCNTLFKSNTTIIYRVNKTDGNLLMYLRGHIFQNTVFSLGRIWVLYKRVIYTNV